MRAALPRDYRTDEHTALVIFVRPSGYATTAAHTVVDEQGRLLGEARIKSNFVVHVSPGKHRFFVLTGSADARALDADLRAGHRYYVELSASPLGQADLYAIAPRVQQWSQRELWVEHTDPLALRESRVIESAAEREIASAHLDGLAEEDRRERTLLPTDDGAP